jgi:hypothetical protein
LAELAVLEVVVGVGAAAIVSEKPDVESCGELSESFTVTLNSKVPLALGVPLIVPLAERVRPAGKEPEARLQI